MPRWFSLTKNVEAYSIILAFEFRTVILSCIFRIKQKMEKERGEQLADIQNVFLDNEYTIMSEIVENERISQRDLSRKLSISVSTVNVLINKMIKDGLVKMTQVSQKQVFYMLTPVGMMEKTKKTMNYLKVHYRAIYELKEKIKSILDELTQKHDVVFILMQDDEIKEMLSSAVSEFQVDHSESNIKIVGRIEEKEIKDVKHPILVYLMEDEKVLEAYTKYADLKLMNLTDKL